VAGGIDRALSPLPIVGVIGGTSPISINVDKSRANKSKVDKSRADADFWKFCDSGNSAILEILRLL
jgi:hypothetical protein